MGHRAVTPTAPHFCILNMPPLQPTTPVQCLLSPAMVLKPHLFPSWSPRLYPPPLCQNSSSTPVEPYIRGPTTTSCCNPKVQGQSLWVLSCGSVDLLQPTRSGLMLPPWALPSLCCPHSPCSPTNVIRRCCSFSLGLLREMCQSPWRPLPWRGSTSSTRARSCSPRCCRNTSCKDRKRTPNPVSERALLSPYVQV